jgi:hypothetical protein
MFQPASDLGFENKSAPTMGVVGTAELDLLKPDFSVQFGVLGNDHFTQPAAGMRPKHTKTWPIAGSVVGRVGLEDAIRFSIGSLYGKMRRACLHVGIYQPTSTHA